jgi:hypothetical protein
MNTRPHAFPRAARLERLVVSLRDGASAALRLVSHPDDLDPSSAERQGAVAALFAAATLSGRGDLDAGTESRIAALREAVSEADSAGVAWHRTLPHPERGGLAAQRLEDFCGLAALLPWTRGTAWLAVAERVDETEVAFFLEGAAAGCGEVADELEALLPDEALARAEAVLTLMRAGPDAPEEEDPLDAAALDAACARAKAAVPLAYVLRDQLMGMGLSSPLVTRSVAYASTEALDDAPAQRVQLARFAEAEANLVLGEGGLTLEWWSAKATLPDRCLAVASAGDAVQLPLAGPSESRSRQWRLDVPRGRVDHFEFFWSDGQAARVALPERATGETA